MRTHTGTTPSRITTPTALTYTTDTGTSAVPERRRVPRSGATGLSDAKARRSP